MLLEEIKRRILFVISQNIQIFPVSQNNKGDACDQRARATMSMPKMKKNLVKRDFG